MSNNDELDIIHTALINLSSLAIYDNYEESNVIVTMINEFANDIIKEISTMNTNHGQNKPPESEIKSKSEKLILNFEEKVVIIQDNIVYDGIGGVGKADNIKMDLVTKDIKIFMNEPKNKVEIVSKDTKWVILKNSELKL